MAFAILSTCYLLYADGLLTKLPNFAGWRCTRGRKPNCEPIKENIGTTTYITRIKITLDQRDCLTR